MNRATLLLATASVAGIAGCLSSQNAPPASDDASFAPDASTPAFDAGADATLAPDGTTPDATVDSAPGVDGATADASLSPDAALDSATDAGTDATALPDTGPAFDAATPTDGPFVLAQNQAGPTGFAIDSTNVYWTNNGNGSVMSIGLGGGTPATLLPPLSGAFPQYAAVTPGNLYWTDKGLGLVMTIALPSGAPVTLASGQVNPVGIVADSTSVYWSGDGTVQTIQKMPLGGLDGGVATTLASNLSAPVSIALDSAFLYWVNLDTGEVMKVGLDGGTPVTLASGQNSPGAIAVDSTSVYWTNDPGGTNTSGMVMKLTPK